MDDNQIIDLLFERSETGLSLLEQKYKGLSVKILSEILPSREDVEECCNDMLVAVWNSIPPKRPASLVAYICTLTRRIGINRHHYNHRSKRDTYQLMLSELDDAIPDPAGADAAQSEQIIEILNRFLYALDKESRVIFVRRYVYLESVTEMAQRFRMSENVLSSRLFRMRQKLKKLLREEHIEV